MNQKSEKEQEMLKNYDRNLKAKQYNEKFNRIFKQIRFNFEFALQFLHEVIKSGRFTGSKVLDIGSGATVHNIASASLKFSQIVQSDYVLDNVEELQRWHQGKSNLDWSQFLNVILDLEKKDGYPISTIEDLETRIRKNVSCVVQGDLLAETVLPLEELKAHGASTPFDLVISVLCIETVAIDYESYVKILKTINGLLRQGGGLIVCGYENGSRWIIGQSAFNHVKLSMEQILNAFKEAGFGNIDVKTMKKMESEYEYNYDSIFCVAVEKL